MARDSKDLQLIELKDNIKELNNTIGNLNSLIEAANKREAEHLAEEQRLREQIDYLTKKLFGKSSEKRDDIEGQLSLLMKRKLLHLMMIRKNRNSSLLRSIHVKRKPLWQISLLTFRHRRFILMFRKISENAKSVVLTSKR